MPALTKCPTTPHGRSGVRQTGFTVFCGRVVGVYPEFVHLDVGTLISGAGGDPWKINDTLQAGSPGEIAQLAETFYNAGVCVGDADLAFYNAKARFEASWNRENGAHPINDGVELQKLTQSIFFQREQLPKIAADLETVAATLAEAQRMATIDLQALEASLHGIDALIDQALQRDEDISGLEKNAIAATKTTLGLVTGLRDEYAQTLAQSMTTLRADGYDPAALDDVDGLGGPTVEERDKAAVDQYDAEQRARDQALVDSGGPMTQDKADAAARLRDDATANDPNADPTARHLASERLDDFTMANFTGPLPVDPLLGGTARDRAQTRLELQRQLEQGLLGSMSPDQATAQLNAGEAQARVMVTQRAIDALQQQGMSPEGAARAVGLLNDGVSLRQVLGVEADRISAAGVAVDAATRSVPTNAHALDRFSEGDLKTLRGISTKIGLAGLALDSGLGIYDVLVNDAPAWRTAGEVAGTAVGGYATGVAAWALAGSVIGPEGAAAAGLVAAVVLSPYFKKAGGWVLGG